MSILNRPGWANKQIINEGLLHTDGLKQRIANLFTRTSLGNSPTYVVGKIADALRDEKGEEYDINTIADEDIIRIASSESITRGKFHPELKDGIANSRQETEGEISDVQDSGLPSDSDDDDDYEDFFEDELDMGDELDEPQEVEIEINATPKLNHKKELEFNFEGDTEDAEEVDTCGCEKEQSPFYKEFAKKNINKIKHPSDLKIKQENIKLSPTEVNRLLKENYVKSRQHKFKLEEKYKNYKNY